MDSERPPSDYPDEAPEPRGDATRDRARRVLERWLRDGVKRAVEKGYEQLTEGPENLRHFVQDLRVPREIAHLILQQADDTKNGMYRAVAREIRDFLDHTNLAEEAVRALTTLSFEIKTEIRFIPNDQRIEVGGSKSMRPDVKASVRIQSDDKTSEKEPKG